MSSPFWHDLREVLLGDLRLQLRDPLALVFMVVLPLAVYPLLFWGVGSAQVAQEEAYAKDTITVAVDAAFVEYVEEDDLLVLAEGEVAEREDEEAEGAVLAELRLHPEEIVVRFRGTGDLSREARDRLEDIAERYRRAQRASAWAAAGMPLEPGQIITIEEVDTSPPEARTGLRAGQLAPLLMVFLIIGTGLYVGLEIFAGDKERGTIETMLTTQVDRRALVTARFAVVTGFAVLTATLALGSLTATLSAGFVVLPGEQSAVSLSVASLVVLGLLLVPLCLQLSAIIMVTSAWAPDYKTGQALSLPMFMGCMAPAAVAALPNIQASTALAFVPITNLSLAIRDAVAGELDPSFLGLTALATLVHAGLAVFLAGRLLERETTLIGGGGGGRRRKLGRYHVEAIGLYLIGLTIFWYLGQLAQARDLVAGLIFSIGGILGGLALATPFWLGIPARKLLSIQRPSLPDLGLALVAAACAPALGDLVAQLQQPVLPVPSEFFEQFAAAMEVDLPLWAMVLLFAALPGIFEELFFRGALQGLLRGSLGPVARCLVVGALFGFLHLSLPRILPTGVLGVYFAASLVRSRSLLIPILLHFGNNAILVVGSEQGWLGEEPTAWWIDLPIALVGVGAIGLMGRWGRPQVPGAQR